MFANYLPRSSRLAAAAITASLGLAVAPLPVTAQTLSPELKALDAQIPGDLVNDPSRIDWDSYGPDFYAESIVDEAIPGGGAARRFHVNSATEYIYTAGTNIPLIRDVDRGDTITIGFWARTVSASTDDGKGVIRVRFQQDAPPYPGFGEETLEIDKDWKWYEVTAEVEQKLRRKDGIIAIQFGRTKQVLEIGQAIVVKGASSIVGDPAPAPVAAQLPPEPELPKPLQGLGTLVNDPTNRDWGLTAASASATARDDNSIWLGKVTQLATDVGSGDASRVEALVSFDGPIAKDEEIIVAIAAKTVGSPRENGKAVLEVGLVSPTAEDFSRSQIEVGTNWQLLRYVAKSPRDLAPGEAVVAINLKGEAQTVDVGPVYVFKAE